MKKELVYTMPRTNSVEIEAIKELKAKLYETHEDVQVYPNGQHEVRVVATGEIEKKPELTHYLFGEDAINEWQENGATEELLDIGFGLFVFEEGVTPSWKLAEAQDGWLEYAIITKEEYDEISAL